MQSIDVAMPRGMCPVLLWEPAGAGDAPVVLLFMDAFGPRPALHTVAERLAGDGYRVLLPHLFYHHLPFAPFDAMTTFGVPAERERLMGYFASVTQTTVDADVDALLGFVADRFGGEVPIACSGYCMGGRYALTAAAASPRVRLAAAFHASNLAPDRADSVHHRFAGVQARIYVGVAGIDPSFGGEEEGRLAAALRDAGTDHVIETYAGAGHGFVMPDLPVYDAAAAERHWQRLRANLAETCAS